MSYLLLPGRDFDYQPEYAAAIDFEGLGKGIQLLFNPAVGPVDLATGRVWAASGDAKAQVTQHGKAFNFDGVGDYLDYTGYPELVGNVGTFFMWCPRVGVPNTYGGIYIAEPSATSYIQVFEDGGVRFNGTGIFSGRLSSWFNTTNRSLIFSSDGTPAGTKCYLDGVDSGMVWSGVPGLWPSGSKALRIGGYQGGGSWDVDASILSIGSTTAVWGAAEAKAFHESKGNALFKAPEIVQFWFGAAGAAALAGDAKAAATASGALTTQIPLTGAALSITTASGALTTQIKLDGAAASIAAAGGDLTAQIQLSGEALVRAISSAALSTAIDLSASAIAEAAANGMLDTAIKLIGSAIGNASASGDLTTGGPSSLEGDAQAIATASGSLTAEIRLNAAAIAQAAASAGLSTAISLAGNAEALASSNAEITASITLTAQAIAQAIASGGLTAQIQLSAAAIAQAIASATLTGQIQLFEDPRFVARGQARGGVLAAGPRGYTTSITIH